MSKLSDAGKELVRFADGLLHCIQAKDIEGLICGAMIACDFIRRTGEVLQTISRKPLILFSRRFDPYADLRPAAQEFIDKWAAH